MNILIPNVGRRGYLVRYLKELDRGKVYVSDCDNTASGLYGENDGHFLLPKPADNPKKYVNTLSALCEEFHIGLVIPVIDPEIAILSHFREHFLTKGVQIAVSSPQVLDVCYNKLHMNQFLKKSGFLFPETVSSLAAMEENLEMGKISFPVILKPILGSGSVETLTAATMDQVRSLYHEGLIIQRKLNGKEYGVDTFNSFSGLPLRCVVKEKISMRGGETDKAVTVRNEKIEGVLLRLASCLGHVANLDSDVIVENEQVYILDLNPRFGGGYPATHAAGVNLLHLLLDMCEGVPVEPQYGNYSEGILVMKEIAIRQSTLWREEDLWKSCH